MLDHAAGVPIRQLRGDASAFNPMLLKASSSGNDRLQTMTSETQNEKINRSQKNRTPYAHPMPENMNADYRTGKLISKMSAESRFVNDFP